MIVCIVVQLHSGNANSACIRLEVNMCINVFHELADLFSTLGNQIQVYTITAWCIIDQFSVLIISTPSRTAPEERQPEARRAAVLLKEAGRCRYDSVL